MADNIQLDPRLTKSVKEVVDVAEFNVRLNNALTLLGAAPVDLENSMRVVMDDELLRNFLVDVERRLNTLNVTLSDVPSLLAGVDLSGVNLTNSFEVAYGVTNTQTVDATISSLDLNFEFLSDENIKHSVSSNPNVVELLVGGRYKVSGYSMLEGTTNTNAIYQSFVSLNGTDRAGPMSTEAIGQPVTVPFVDIFDINPGDQLEFKLQMFSGTAGDGATRPDGTKIILERLHV